MPDSKLVLFGKPAAGAAVMVAAPLAALDIPLKVLVWEDGNAAVSVSYNSPGFLAERHHLEGALRAPFDAVRPGQPQRRGRPLLRHRKGGHRWHRQRPDATPEEVKAGLEQIKWMPCTNGGPGCYLPSPSTTTRSRTGRRS